MSVLKFRVVLDTKADVFRDIEILTDQTFEEFHVAICNAFGFVGDQMASFYMSDDVWSKGQEITLMSVVEGKPEEGAPLLMENTVMDDMIIEEDEKLVYVYDFLRMWCFFIELIEESKEISDREYPRITLRLGETPSEDSKKQAAIDNAYDDDDEEEEDDNDSSLSEDLEEMYSGDDLEDAEDKGPEFVELPEE